MLSQDLLLLSVLEARRIIALHLYILFCSCGRLHIIIRIVDCEMPRVLSTEQMTYVSNTHCPKYTMFPRSPAKAVGRAKRGRQGPKKRDEEEAVGWYTFGEDASRSARQLRVFMIITLPLLCPQSCSWPFT